MGGDSPGGTITVNGVKIIIPDNLVVQMPAAAFSWAQMFNPAVSHSFNYAPARPNHRFGQTGLALADNPLSGTRAGVAGAVGPFPSSAPKAPQRALLAPLLPPEG